MIGTESTSYVVNSVLLLRSPTQTLDMMQSLTRIRKSLVKGRLGRGKFDIASRFQPASTLDKALKVFSDYWQLTRRYLKLGSKENLLSKEMPINLTNDAKCRMALSMYRLVTRYDPRDRVKCAHWIRRGKSVFQSKVWHADCFQWCECCCNCRSSRRLHYLRWFIMCADVGSPKSKQSTLLAKVLQEWKLPLFGNALHTDFS